MSTEKLKPNWFDALLDDIIPVVPYVGQWTLNYCVDIGVTLVHPIRMALSGEQKHSTINVFLRFLATLVRYPVQLVLTIGSLVLNAVASVINNVFIGSHERPLTQEEIRYLKPIFGSGVDYNSVRLQFGGVKETLMISPQAVGNDIFMRQFWGDRVVYPDGTLSAAGLRLLGHEVAHVWQYQNSGAGYIGDSLMTQVLDMIGRKMDIRLSDGYDLCSALKEQRTVDECNVEQQAVMAELIGASCSIDESGTLTRESFNRVSGFNLSREEFACAAHAHSWFDRSC